MKQAVGRYLFTIVGASLLATGTAHADRTIIILLDQSGSMATPRSSDSVVRYEKARQLAAQRVFNAATVDVEGLANVAVIAFSETSTYPLTGGTINNPTFVDTDTAIAAINNPANNYIPGALTPLADGMCDAIRALRNPILTTTIRRLETYTDGGENNSVLESIDPNKCGGTWSGSGHPYDGDGGGGIPVEDSWQQNVLHLATLFLPGVELTTSTTLFTNVETALFFGGGGGGGGFVNPELARLGKLGRIVISSLLAPISDEQFFRELAEVTGGTFTLVLDSQPVPVFADVDGDFDVDRNDAIALARQFGAPATEEFDLNNDGAIGWGDYAVLIARFGTGTGTPAPDPYSEADTISCGNNDHIVLDGLAIEDEGITIDARNKCTITIRNSLIVSGASAIRFRGSARLTVENSIIVGEGSWVSGTGVVKLTASNSVFHGAQSVAGMVAYVDQGGNVFE